MSLGATVISSAPLWFSPMESLAQLRPLTFPFPSHNVHLRSKSFQTNPRSRFFCSSIRSQATDAIDRAEKKEYKPGVLDNLMLAWFRKKMVEEVGWDSEKPGYDGLMEVVNRLMAKGKSNSETVQAAVHVLVSLFPRFLLDNFQMLMAPIGGGKLAAMMVARVTAISCQWLMGPCTVNSVKLPNGSSCSSGVFVERCKYLEESKCVGICIHTCKLPTQTFFKDYMGVPLLMEPNFSDFSCQFNFGVNPPLAAEDKALQEPCLEICPNATRRRERSRNVDVLKCPKV